jgi:hypothetical protein
MDHTIEINTSENGVRLYNTITTTIEKHAELLDSIKEHMAIVVKLKSVNLDSKVVQNLSEYVIILEFGALLNISILDLSVISRQLYLTQNKWESMFYVKHGYSIIRATLERYQKQISLVKKLIDKNGPHLLQNFRTIGNDLSKFKNDFKYESHMKPVRDETAAHFDSFEIYYDTLHSVNNIEAFNAIITFVNLLSRLIDFSTALLNASKIE